MRYQGHGSLKRGSTPSSRCMLWLRLQWVCGALLLLLLLCVLCVLCFRAVCGLLVVVVGRVAIVVVVVVVIVNVRRVVVSEVFHFYPRVERYLSVHAHRGVAF